MAKPGRPWRRSGSHSFGQGLSARAHAPPRVHPTGSGPRVPSRAPSQASLLPGWPWGGPWGRLARGGSHPHPGRGAGGPMDRCPTGRAPPPRPRTPPPTLSLLGAATRAHSQPAPPRGSPRRPCLPSSSRKSSAEGRAFGPCRAQAGRRERRVEGEPGSRLVGDAGGRRRHRMSDRCTRRRRRAGRAGAHRRTPFAARGGVRAGLRQGGGVGRRGGVGSRNWGGVRRRGCPGRVREAG